MGKLIKKVTSLFWRYVCSFRDAEKKRRFFGKWRISRCLEAVRRRRGSC